MKLTLIWNVDRSKNLVAEIASRAHFLLDYAAPYFFINAIQKSIEQNIKWNLGS